MTYGYSTGRFEKKYTYRGGDLGAVWEPEGTTFRLWAPTAAAAAVCLCAGGDAARSDRTARVPMRPDVRGTWLARIPGDLRGVYYTFEVTVDGERREAVDPYARAVGVNGRRGMILDLASTDPPGWEGDTNPQEGRGYTDAVIYELHVRDLSCHESSGIRNRGKFAGLAETGAVTPGGHPTGLDHIRALGVTHVHLLPIYDYGSVDEAAPGAPQYNWGYDPVNFNAPEGSYSSDPFDGAVRIRELKEAILALHRNSLGVIMDVVYNHVYETEDFCFNRLVPGYFSRTDRAGNYSNGSCCGNDTATERSMVRRYIVDSVKYWCDEYHLDGFRFDLAGLIDTDTVNEIVEKVHASRPDVLFYGEGWTMPTAVTKRGVSLATQTNSRLTPGFAYFSDTIRDALRGRFNERGPGFVGGRTGLAATVEACWMGEAPWCGSPEQTVNYVSCHDDHTLFDRICLSRPDASPEEAARMNRLAAAICLTAQGIPFLQAGEELLRTKRDSRGRVVENSYKSPDAVNAIRWSDLDDPAVHRVFDYYRGLIAFRKAHPALRLTTAAAVRESVRPVRGLGEHMVAFEVAEGEERLFLAFNAENRERTVPLPGGTWDVYISGDAAGTGALGTAEGSARVEPVSALALVRRREVQDEI